MMKVGKSDGLRGQSAVEFGLIVMVTITMFLGMVQFGMYLCGLSIVENAARHAARIGSVSQGCPACDAVLAAKSALAGQPVVRDGQVAVLAPGGRVGSIVKIQVSASIPMVVPGGALFGLDILTTVSAESTFRQEGW